MAEVSLNCEIDPFNLWFNAHLSIPFVDAKRKAANARAIIPILAIVVCWSESQETVFNRNYRNSAFVRKVRISRCLLRTRL
jgi:hypothetical protein